MTDPDRPAPSRIVHLGEEMGDSRYTGVERMLDVALNAVCVDSPTRAKRAVLIVEWENPDGSYTWEPRVAGCTLQTALGLLVLGQDALLRRDDEE